MSMVPNCPWCQIVCGAKLSTLHCGAKLSAVPNCPLYTLGAKLSGAKLSTVPNCPRCQIVRGAKLSTLHCGAKLSAVPNCPLYTLGAKLSGAKLSAVPNCPRCQIVRGAKLSYNREIRMSDKGHLIFCWFGGILWEILGIFCLYHLIKLFHLIKWG